MFLICEFSKNSGVQIMNTEFMKQKIQLTRVWETAKSL